MIKGVTKQILEVTNPDSPYFEKIVFFVKSEHQSADREKLKKEAGQLASQAQKPPRLKRSGNVLAQVGICLAFAVASAGITLLINYLV